MRAMTRDLEATSSSRTAGRSNAATRQRHNVGKSTTENVMQINVGVWHKDLREVYQAGKAGPGAVALLSIINLQLAQAAEWTAGITRDVFIERALETWGEDYQAAQARLEVLLKQLASIAKGLPDPSVRALAIYNQIARPVLDGVYPPELLSKFPTIAKRGITVRADGTGKGIGDAVGSATLWNQAVIAGDIDRKLGEGWAKDYVRNTLTEVAAQLEEAGPGDDPTARDLTIATIEKIAAAPEAIFRAVLGNPYLWGAAILVVGGIVVWLAVKK